MGQEVSGDINESLYVTWEGTRDEKRDWLRGQCDAIYARMLRGESHSDQMEDADAHVQEL